MQGPDAFLYQYNVIYFEDEYLQKFMSACKSLEPLDIFGLVLEKLYPLDPSV